MDNQKKNFFFLKKFFASFFSCIFNQIFTFEAGFGLIWVKQFNLNLTATFIKIIKEHAL